MPANPKAGIYASAPGRDDALLRITLLKSTIGQLEKQKLTVKALGLRRMHQTVIRPDSPVVRGMVYAVRHLVRVEDAAEGEERTKGTQSIKRSQAAAGASETSNATA